MKKCKTADRQAGALQEIGIEKFFTIGYLTKG